MGVGQMSWELYGWEWTISFRLNLLPGIDRVPAWLVCSCIAPVRYPPLLGETQGEEILEDQFCPVPRARPGRDETSATLILSIDFASTIWMAGGGAFTKPGEEHALVVSHKIFAPSKTNGRMGPGMPGERRSLLRRDGFSASRSRFLRACDSACMSACGCMPNFFPKPKQRGLSGDDFAANVASFAVSVQETASPYTWIPP